MSTRQPTNPHVSANTAKMKSVWRSGRKASRLCVAPATPLPKSCPEPIAILAWMTLYALPSGSRNGSRKTRMRSRWYSFIARNHTRGSADTPASAAPPSSRNRIPAPTRRAVSTGKSSSAVPRSGCLTISSAGTTSTGAVSASVILPTGCAQRDVSTHVAISTKQILKTSEGCTDIGPIRIQRRAPETERPQTDQAPVIDRSHHDEGTEAHGEPGKLAEGDVAAGAPDVQAGQRGRAQDHEAAHGAQQRPVHVLQQPPVDPAQDGHGEESSR